MKARSFEDLKGIKLSSPSLKLSAEKNGVRVTSTLYGPLDDARRAQAKRDLLHRLDQLIPVPKKEPKFFVDPFGFAHQLKDEEE